MRKKEKKKNYVKRNNENYQDLTVEKHEESPILSKNSKDFIEKLKKLTISYDDSNFLDNEEISKNKFIKNIKFEDNGIQIQK